MPLWNINGRSGARSGKMCGNFNLQALSQLAHVNDYAALP
jgi:hypothetical protein